MFLPAVLRFFSFSLNRLVSADPVCYQLASNCRGGALCLWLLPDHKVRASRFGQDTSKSVQKVLL